MNNKIFYVKPQEFDFPSAISAGIRKGFELAKTKKYTNMKLVLSSLRLLEGTSNQISDGFDQIFKGYGLAILNTLKKNRMFSFPDYPQNGLNFGINVLLANQELHFTNHETVVVLLWADEKTLKKVQTELAFTQLDLIAVIYNTTPALNEMLSASRASNLSKKPDQEVTLYDNSFSAEVNAVLLRLKSINTTDSGTTHYALEAFKDVIGVLKKKGVVISFGEFLGFLINDVGFPIGHSLDLLASQKKYFGR